MTENLIEAVKVLSLQPGDTLVLKTSKRLSVEQLATLEKQAAAFFPPEHRVAVLDDGLDVAVVRKQQPKVFVILPAYDCEGYGKPIAAFTDKSKADAECARLNALPPGHAERQGDDHAVHEVDVTT